MSARTQALMVQTPIKAQQVALTELSEDVRATRPGFAWTLDLERARLVTESYRRTENEPMVLRRAKALAHILEQMTVYIRRDEMIVGNLRIQLDSVPSSRAGMEVDPARDRPGQVYECMLSDQAGRSSRRSASTGRLLDPSQNELPPRGARRVFWVFNWEASTPNYDRISPSVSRNPGGGRGAQGQAGRGVSGRDAEGRGVPPQARRADAMGSRFER
jgi:hypothetical protein